MALKIEVNEVQVSDPSAGNAVMVTPPIGQDFWWALVPLGGGQAVVCFPKFSTVGIGFQHEEDWNTNLPYTSSAEDIYDHIRHNKGRSCRASRARCIEAISLLQGWVRRYSDVTNA